MHKLLLCMMFCFLAAAIVLNIPTQARADAIVVTIDDYQVGDYTLGREGTPVPYSVSATQFDGSGTHILGGQRDVTFNKLTGSSTQPYISLISTVTYLGFTGISTFNSSFGNNAVWTTTYGLAADLNADLTAAGIADRLSIEIDGDQNDSSPVRPLPFEITVFSGTGSASVSKNLVADGVHSWNFTEFAGVDFTDVDRIVIEFTQNSSSNDAVDFAIFHFYAGAESVPTEKTTWSRVKSLYGEE